MLKALYNIKEGAGWGVIQNKITSNFGNIIEYEQIAPVMHTV